MVWIAFLLSIEFLMSTFDRIVVFLLVFLCHGCAVYIVMIVNLFNCVFFFLIVVRCLALLLMLLLCMECFSGNNFEVACVWCR